MGSGLGWLSKELLCSQKEAQGFAWKDLCPEFVGLVPKPYSPSTSTSTVFSRRSYLTTPVCMAHPSFELMCRVTSELSSLVCPHTSLSWRLPEGNQFLYEHQTININFDMNHHKRSPSDITWVDKTSHQMFVPASQFLSGELPRTSVLSRLRFACLPLSTPFLPELWSYPSTSTKILPLGFHCILTSCYPQGCMFRPRNTISCSRGTSFFLLQGYSCSMCDSLGLEFSLSPCLPAANSFFFF